MARKHLLTTEVARAAGVHPNTVRMYEEWGYISRPPRSPAGYRLYSEEHRDQMILARLALQFPYPGGKKVVVEILHCVMRADYAGAIHCARTYQANIRRERAQAEAAADFLEAWAAGTIPAEHGRPVQIGAAAGILAVSRDVLRDWERNGLIRTGRNPQNRYRFYSPEDIGRLRVIRVLRQAGYSTMAVLRMIHAMDQGRRDGLRQLLDTPSPDEDICYITDRWISTLAAQETRAEQILATVEALRDKSQAIP